MYHCHIITILSLSWTSATYIDQVTYNEFPDEGHGRWTSKLQRHLRETNSLFFPPLSLDNYSAVNANLYSGFHDGVSNHYENMDERFFPIFSVVRFANAPCTVGGQSGTCYTSRECSNLGGTNIGICARGFGICCYKEITCGGSTSMNCTYLVSPNYPGTYNEARTCSMTFTRTTDNICQLRMDFEDFESIPPTTLGVCGDDQFSVAGERKFDYLCGTSPSNWHFYLDVNGKSNPTVFNFATSSTSFDRKFRIKISMIECEQKVPCGCGQYYTGDTGTIQSFNYGGYYLSQVNYGICLRKEKNHCTTTFTREGPSFITCPDLYRVPVGQSSATTPNAGFNIQNLYCQINLNPIGFLAPFSSATIIPTPQTSVTNGPVVIWHQTTSDNAANYHSNINCHSCSGFYQTFQHNSC